MRSAAAARAEKPMMRAGRQGSLAMQEVRTKAAA